MESPELIAEAKRLAGVPLGSGTQVFTDQEISDLLATKGLYGTVAYIWTQYASELTVLVDVSESGSSRKLGDMMKNALAMAKTYTDWNNEAIILVTGRPKTRAIVRP